MRRIDETKLYRDTETGEIINEMELYKEYFETDVECDFWAYVRNCLDKNGFLEEVR